MGPDVDGTCAQRLRDVIVEGIEARRLCRGAALALGAAAEGAREAVGTVVGGAMLVTVTPSAELAADGEMIGIRSRLATCAAGTVALEQPAPMIALTPSPPNTCDVSSSAPVSPPLLSQWLS